MFGERLFGLRGDERRVDNSLARSFGGVIAFKAFRADSFFGEEFNRVDDPYHEFLDRIICSDDYGK